jgi:hypothetical protein
MCRSHVNSTYERPWPTVTRYALGSGAGDTEGGWAPRWFIAPRLSGIWGCHGVRSAISKSIIVHFHLLTIGEEEIVLLMSSHMQNTFKNYFKTIYLTKIFTTRTRLTIFWRIFLHYFFNKVAFFCETQINEKTNKYSLRMNKYIQRRTNIQ